MLNLSLIHIFAHTNLPDYDLAYTLEYNLRKYKELEKIQIQNRKKIFWIVLFEDVYKRQIPK